MLRTLRSPNWLSRSSPGAKPSTAAKLAAVLKSTAETGHGPNGDHLAGSLEASPSGGQRSAVARPARCGVARLDSPLSGLARPGRVHDQSAGVRVAATYLGRRIRFIRP
jgi:hypothetical protein